MPFHAPSFRVCYGIDASATPPLVVRGVRSGRGVATETVPPDLAADRVRRDLAAGRAITAAAMPARDSVMRWLSTPLPSRSKADRVWPSLLDLELPFPVEQAASDFTAVQPAAAGGWRALGVAAEREKADAFVARLAGAGLDVVALDHDGLAAWRQSLEEEPPASDREWRVVAWLGADRAFLSVGRGSAFEGAHAMSAPSAGAASEFASRVRRLLLARNVGADTVAWCWTGPAARTASPLADLEAALPAAGAFRFVRHPGPESFLARALCRRALRPDAFSCNLRRGVWEHPVLPAVRRRSRVRAAAACLAAALALAGVQAVRLADIRGREAVAADAVRRAAQELVGRAQLQRGFEVRQAASALDRRRQEADVWLAMGGPSRLQDVRRLMAAAKSGGLRLDSLELRPDHLRVSGAATTADGVARLEKEAAALRFEVRAEVQTVTNGLVRFVADGKPREPKPAAGGGT